MTKGGHAYDIAAPVSSITTSSSEQILSLSIQLDRIGMSGLTMREEVGELGVEYKTLEKDEWGIEQVYMDQYKRSKTSPLRATEVQYVVANLMNKGRHLLAHTILLPSFRLE